MATKTEEYLARIVRQSLEAKVEKNIEWAWYRYQCEALDLGRKADKKLYCKLADEYIDYQIELYNKKRGLISK